jgi:hypothetical protein
MAYFAILVAYFASMPYLWHIVPYLWHIVPYLWHIVPYLWHIMQYSACNRDIIEHNRAYIARTISRNRQDLHRFSPILQDATRIRVEMLDLLETRARQLGQVGRRRGRRAFAGAKSKLMADSPSCCASPSCCGAAVDLKLTARSCLLRRQQDNFEEAR